MIRNLTAICLAILMSIGGLAGESIAATKKKPRGPSLPLIRDAEIEGLLRLYSKPIFRAAGLNPSAVRVYIINNDKINAFVAGGQRMFIHTGLLTRTETPNEVIGVLAHETGHIAGGHLARMGIELDRASVQSIIGTLVGVAAVVGGAAAGQSGASQAGQGIVLGSQGLAQRNLLSYQRDMEASADQAALKYLKATDQSPKGMLTLFQTLANESLASLEYADPYLLSHPMPLERIRNLELEAKKSKFFDQEDAPQLLLRHQLMQAKLAGFMQSPQFVFQRYPSNDKSLPSRYARSISMFRKGDTKNAVPLIDSLIRDVPEDPYFWELKGQALLEGGAPAKAIAPLRQANKLLPNSGLIQILYAQALIATENRANIKQALNLLTLAKKTERDSIDIYKYSALAYGYLNDVPRAELATAEAAMMQGDTALAAEKAKRVIGQFKRGTPEWIRANDILNFANKE
ncbi:MAG TPA: M48 family metalloprotease [Aestuariivirga sp.]|jgi:predicted Zn-dependent protease